MSSVWTSQHPHLHHSAVSFSSRLPAQTLTLAQVLSARGIASAGLRGQRHGRNRLRPRSRLRASSRRCSGAAATPTCCAALSRPGWSSQSGPALLPVRALPRAALPVRPARAFRHEVRPGRPDPEGRAARPGLAHGDQPGPARALRPTSRRTSSGSTTGAWPSRTRSSAGCGARSRRRASGRGPS